MCVRCMEWRRIAGIVTPQTHAQSEKNRKIAAEFKKLAALHVEKATAPEPKPKAP